jgi:hypothetical protein
MAVGITKYRYSHAVVVSVFLSGKTERTADGLGPRAALAEREQGMSEVWKPVPKFSAYEVSSLGRIRRVTEYVGRGQRRPLPYVLTPNSAGRVALRADNFRVHQVSLARLVAQVFKPPTRPALVVGHRDGDPNNRAVSNLGWQMRQSRRGRFTGKSRFWVD